jgi:chromosome segregation ATPase
MANSKTDRSIYKPKGSHRVSKRHRYRMPDRKMYGGEIEIDGEGNPVGMNTSTDEEVKLDNVDIQSGNLETSGEEVKTDDDPGIWDKIKQTITGATDVATESASEEADKASKLVAGTNSAEAEDTLASDQEPEINNELNAQVDELNAKNRELEAKIQELEAKIENDAQKIEALHDQLEQEKDKVNDALQQHLDTLSNTNTTNNSSTNNTNISEMNNSSDLAKMDSQPADEMDVQANSDKLSEVISPGSDEMDVQANSDKLSEVISPGSDEMDVQDAQPEMDVQPNSDKLNEVPLPEVKPTIGQVGGKKRTTLRRRRNKGN